MTGAERFRRVVKWVAILIAVLLAALAILHLPPIQTHVSRALVRAVAERVDGRLEIRRLTYSLWKGEISVESLDYEQESESLTVSVRVPRIDVDWMPLSRVGLFLQSPVVELRGRAGAESNEAQPADSGRPIEPRLPGFLGGVAIDEGRFLWVDASGRLAELGPFDLSLDDSEIGGFSGRLVISEGRAQLQGEAIQLRRGTASLEGTGGTLHVDESRFDFDAGSLEPEAEIRTFSPFSGDVAVDFRLDRAALGRLLDEPSLRGEFEGDVELSVREEGVSGEGSLEASGLSWRQLGPWQAEVDWELTHEALRIQPLQLRGYGGSVQAEASLELAAGGRQAAEIQWTSLPVRPLVGVGETTEASIPWQATTSGTANLSLVDWNAQTVSGSAEIDFDEDIEGRVLVAANDGDLEVSGSELSVPGGSLDIEAELEDLDQLAADVRLSLDDVSVLASVVLPPNGVTVDGPLDVQATVAGELTSLATLHSRARLDSEGFLLNGERLALDGLFRYENEVVHVDQLLLETRTEGRLSVEGTVHPSGSSALEARLESFPLSVVPQEMGIADGTVSGQIVLEGPIADPNVDARLEAEDLTYRGIEGSATIAVHKQGTEVGVERLDLRLGEGALHAAGTFDTRTQELSVSAEGQDLALHRLLVGLGWPGALRAELARLDVNLSGSLDRPSGDAVLNLEDVAFRGEALPAASITIESSGVEATAELSLESDRRLLLAETTLREDFPTTVTLTLDYVPWSTLATALEWDEITSVEVAGKVESRLPLAQPGAFALATSVSEVSARVGDVLIRAPAPFEISGDAERIQVEGFALAGEGVDLSIDGEVMLANGEASSLHARGQLELEPWGGLVPGDALGGTAELDVTFTGTFQRPRLRGTASIQNGRWSDGPLVVEGLETVLRARGAIIEMEQLEATVLGGILSAEGALPLPDADTEGEGPELSFSARELDFAPLLAGEDSEPDVDLMVSVEGDASFAGGSLAEIGASGAITQLLLRTPASEVASTSPARWSLTEGRFDLDTVELSGPETELEIGAEASFAGDETDWSASVQGHLDLDLASPFLPESAFVSGPLHVDARVRGRAGELVLEGTSSLEGGELVLERPPLVLSEMDADIRLDENAVVLEHLKAQANGGTLTAEGRLPLAGPQEGETGTSVQLVAEGLRLEYPEGFRSRIDAELELSDGDGYDLSGHVFIDEARYGRDVSVERELVRALQRQTVDIAREPGLADRLHLNIDVDSRSDIVVDNNLGQIRAEANLLLTGTAAAPEISGTARARPGGELRFAGNTYDIETARVDLYAYPTTAPEVDVRAHTRSGGYDLVLQLSGSLDNLRTTLSSPGDPSLSRADVTSLLLTGRTLEEVRGDEGQVVGGQAAQYLAGGLASVTEDELGEALPVTSVSIAPVLVGSETDPGARLSLGQALSEDLYLTYSIGLSDTQSQLWIIDYELPRDLGVRAVRDDGNEYTGELSQSLLFDVYHRERPIELPEVEGPEIRSVRLAGELPASEEAIRDDLSLSRGDRFDYWEAREDAEGIRRKLQDAGYLGARVLVDTEEIEGASDEVSLAYTIASGKPIRIVWSGDDPGEDLRKSISDRWDPHLPARAVARRIARNLTWELKSRGFFGAAVEATISESADEIALGFHVERGPQGSEVELEFLGNEVIEDDVLEIVPPDPSTPAFFQTVLAEDEEFRERIRLLYATRGYLEGRVVEVNERFDVPSGTYRVEIQIEEGEPTYVSNVVFEGADEVPEEQLRSLLALRPGAILRLDEFLQDQQKLRSFYRGEGFANARVRSRLGTSADGFRVIHEVEENERIRVGRIDVTGNAVTDEETIRDTLTLEPGDPLRLEDLTETQSRLYDLQTFRSVDVRVERTETPGVSDVVVDVVELPDVSFGYGARYSTEDRWEVTGNVDLPNILGDARRLNLSAFVNRNAQTYRGTYHLPYFFGLDLDTDFFVSREIETEETFTSRGWAVTFQQGRQIRDPLRVQWSYTFRQADVEAVAAPGDPFGFDVVANRGILSTSLIHDSRDSLTSPTRGWFWNGTMQFAAAAIGSDLRFVKFYGQLFYFRPVIGRGIIWASTYRAGVAQPFGDQVLLRQDRFQAGGPNSVRGFPNDELGPADSLLGTNIGGEGVVVLNQELRIPVWKRFGAVVFYDAGNVYLDVNDFNPLDLRHTLGLGVRVQLPVGLARVDWARVLNPQPALGVSRFHFSFGHAF